MSDDEVPAQLRRWTRGQLSAIRQALSDADTAAGAEDGDAGAVTEQLLKALTRLEWVSRRTGHGLTAYAIRHRVLTQSQIARATSITITAAGSRASSKLALDAYDEVFPTAPAGAEAGD